MIQVDLNPGQNGCPGLAPRSPLGLVAHFASLTSFTTLSTYFCPTMSLAAVTVATGHDGGSVECQTVALRADAVLTSYDPVILSLFFPTSDPPLIQKNRQLKFEYPDRRVTKKAVWDHSDVFFG